MPLKPLRLRVSARPLLWIATLGAALGCAAPVPRREGSSKHASGGCVVSQSAIASAVGADALRRGGNAVDAAIATALALAVVHPEAGNIGGGGFLLARLPDGTATTFDFRETAPRLARPDLFLDAAGSYQDQWHHHSLLSVGVPGTVAGLHLAHTRLGRLPWRELVEPAVRLARTGFPVSAGLAQALESRLPELQKHAPTLAQFSRDGVALRPGELLVQPDLARTLERIRDEGPAGFYTGLTAELIVQEMEANGGLIRLEDLADYKAVERPALRSTYRGYEVLGMPPPSSGGVAIATVLNILEGFDLPGLALRGPEETHLIVEAMRRAFADRARHLGDADQVEVPVERLVSKEHAAELRASIRPDRASPSDPGSFEWPAEGVETTHLSVVDGDLLAVSLTTTIEQSYGLGRVVPGAGFLLNNEMGDFNAKPGLTNEKGLIGTPPNLAAPGKRMLSSMSPTIIVKEGEPVLVLGSPGGRTIINSVLLVILAVLDHGLPIQKAVDLGRFHHQWLPDEVAAEPAALPDITSAALKALGHAIRLQVGPQGSVQAIGVLPGDGYGPLLEPGVDHRRPDAAAIFAR